MIDSVIFGRGYVRCVVIGACIAAALTTGGCAKKEKQTIESIADIQKREGIPVRTVTLSPGPLEAVELISGTCEGLSQTTLNAGMPGTISAIKVRVGESVNKDQSLMNINPDLPSSYELTKTQYENTARTRDRLKALAEQGGVAQETIDQIETGYAAAASGLNAIEKSQFVQAPFAGTVVDIIATVNNKVGPGDELVTIATIAKIRVVAKVSENIVHRFARGQKAYVVSGTDTLEGVVDEVAIAGQSTGHVFPVKVLFTNKNTALRPGMYVTVSVVSASKNAVVSLPMDAIINEGSQRFVYAVENGVARRVPVSLGIRGGTRYEVLDGLADGAVVVTEGQSNLSDGIKVRVVQ